MVHYPIPIALVMFMAVTGLLMLTLFLYQAYEISVRRTTYMQPYRCFWRCAW
jgi:hypothetical protein